MDPILEQLKTLGCDIDHMRKNLDDDEFYVSCLRALATDENFEGLAQTIAQGNYEQAFDHAHTLKGVCANLGVLPLFASVPPIVESLRHHEYGNIGAELAAVQAEYQKYVKIVGG